MFTLPKKIKELALLFHTHSHELFLVGGSVRDLLLHKEPKDWDFTTNIPPEALISLAESIEIRAVYTNTFGTVSYVFEDEPLDSPLREIQITPYRTESNYTDGRHPGEVSWATTIQEDLSRRDFTINAIAYDIATNTLVDPFNGQKDLQNGILRTVGNPTERFTEDALRIIRLFRFMATLDFSASSETLAALPPLIDSISKLSHERVRDEFFKIVISNNPEKVFHEMHETGILPIILPEISEGYACNQSRSHIYDVFTHCVKALQNAADNKFPLHVRLAALFHDIGKPRTKRFDPKQNLFTFYGHEVVGAKMSDKLLTRLKCPLDLKDKVVKLVRYHMFLSDPDKVTHSAARRLVQNVGPELIWDLIDVRKCDRKGMGKNEEPVRLRKFEVLIEEVLRDPISVTQLTIGGNDLMNELNMKPGKQFGWILHGLLEEVIEDPTLNTKEYLLKRAGELAQLPEVELQKIGEQGREAKEEADQKERDIIKEAYHV